MSKTETAERIDEGGEDVSDEKDEKPPESGSSSKRPPIGRLILATLALLVACDIGARVFFSVHQRHLDEQLAGQYPPNTYMTSFAARVDYRFINLYTMNAEK